MTDRQPDTRAKPKNPRFSPARWLRNRFIAGVLVAMPIVAIIWLISNLIGAIDRAVWSIIPPRLDPSNYFDFPFFWLLSLLLAVFGSVSYVFPKV